MFAQDGSKFPSIVFIKPQTLSNRVVLVPLAELANLPASKYLTLSCLEVRLHNQPSVVNQTILVDNVEDLSIDVY